MTLKPRSVDIRQVVRYRRIFRHQRAIPQYVVGHAERLVAIDERLKALPGLILTGNAFFGIGLNDCVNAANKAGEQVVSCLQGMD